MRKKRKTSRHHLIPKERVKLKTVNKDQSKFFLPRVLRLWRDKHDAWHILFGNLTLSEIIKVLQRIERIKSLN